MGTSLYMQKRLPLVIPAISSGKKLCLHFKTTRLLTKRMFAIRPVKFQTVVLGILDNGNCLFTLSFFALLMLQVSSSPGGASRCEPSTSSASREGQATTPASNSSHILLKAQVEEADSDSEQSPPQIHRPPSSGRGRWRRVTAPPLYQPGRARVVFPEVRKDLLQEESGTLIDLYFTSIQILKCLYSLCWLQEFWFVLMYILYIFPQEWERWEWGNQRQSVKE